MSQFSRPNPLLAAVSKAGAAVSALSGVIAYLITSGLISASQAVAITTAVLDAQETTAQVGGIVAGVVTALGGLAASLGTAQVAKESVTPTSDPRADDGRPLVPAPVAVDPIVDPNPGAV